jgi:TRAP-type transport system periplasmic protein
VANASSIHRLTTADYDAFRKASDLVDEEWVKEITAKGHNGKLLLDSARNLIKKHTK